jgi:hypothetical protein
MRSMAEPCRCPGWSTWWQSSRWRRTPPGMRSMGASGHAVMPKRAALRGSYHHHSRHSHGQPIVAGWNYSWLVHIPERCSSWTAPLRVRRMTPGETSNQGAAEQIRSFLRQRGARQPRPTFTFDAGYDPVQVGVALAGEDMGALVRLRSGRCFYADPPKEPTGGRPRRQGTKLVCDDPTTWPTPSDEWSMPDTDYGWVRLQCWNELHAIPHNHEKKGTRQARPIVRGTLIRLEVERLPKRTKAPVPLWLWWWGPEPPDLETIWRVYIARFSIEHTFRFCKQVRKLDDAQTALPRGGGSLDLVGDPGLRPTAPGSPLSCRSSSALATTASCSETDPCSGASGLFAPSADTGHSGVRPKTLWTLARTTKRAAIKTGQADSCG